MRAIRRKAIRNMRRSVWRMPSVHCQDKNRGRKMIGLKFGCLHCSGAPFPIVSCLLLYRKGHKSEMQKTRINGKKFVQYLVKVNCETDFPVMLFLAVANGNVVRAVFCFRLWL